MGDFFHGWRRKIGVMLLLAACLFMMGWVRSNSKKDWIAFEGLYALSEAGKVTVIRDNSPILSGQRIVWGTRTADRKQNPLIGRSFESSNDYWTAHIVKWRMDFVGFHFGVGRRRSWTEKRSVELWVVPYWSIVVPLTAVSAFLLLSRPGRSTPKHVAEPPASEVANS